MLYSYINFIHIYSYTCWDRDREARARSRYLLVVGESPRNWWTLWIPTRLRPFARHVIGIIGQFVNSMNKYSLWMVTLGYASFGKKQDEVTKFSSHFGVVKIVSLIRSLRCPDLLTRVKEELEGLVGILGHRALVFSARPFWSYSLCPKTSASSPKVRVPLPATRLLYTKKTPLDRQ